jgi:adenylate kinase
MNQHLKTERRRDMTTVLQRLVARWRRVFVWAFHPVKVLIVFGPPGSGKGTTAVELAPLLGLGHLSTGHVFRQELGQNPALAKFLASGGLAPDDLTDSLVSRELCQKKFDSGCILDGYPRNMAQIRALEKLLSHSRSRVTKVIFLDVPPSEIIERLTNRRICSKCGRSYNLLFLKPRIENVCDVCQGALYQRPDDVEDVIAERLRVYQQETKPLLAYFAKQGLLFRITSGSPKQVLQKVIQELG